MNTMIPWTFANTISLCRIPLAFAFLQEQPLIRLAAIFLAMLTDVLDGYLARRSKMIFKIGTVLDPLTDRFFVIFAFSMLMSEQGIHFWKLLAILSRDMAIFCFGFYLFVCGKLWDYRPKALFWGKVTTGSQLLVLLALTMNFSIPLLVYEGFIALGVLAGIELIRCHMSKLGRNGTFF